VRLPLDTEHALLRIAQEALNNAMRHAPGSAMRVTLRVGVKTVTLRVHDDGPGFNPAALPHTRRGMGLATMRERADEIGARLAIQSSGGGTTITVRVPST
jgi:signal transduction histidine kinase